MTQKIRINIRNGKLKINGKNPPKIVQRSHVYYDTMMMCVGLQKLSSSVQFNKTIAELHKCAGLEKRFKDELQTAIWEAVKHGKSIKEVVARLRLIKHNWKTVLASEQFARSIRRLHINQSVILRDRAGRKIKVTKLYGQLKVDLTKTLSIILHHRNVSPRDLFSCRSIIRYPASVREVLVNNQRIGEQEAFERLVAFEKPGVDLDRGHEQIFKDSLLFTRIRGLKNREKLARTLPNGLTITIQKRNGQFYAKTNIDIAFIIEKRKNRVEDDVLNYFARLMQGFTISQVFFEDRMKHFLDLSYDLVIFGRTWPKNRTNLALVRDCLLKNQSPSIHALLDSPNIDDQAVPASC